MKKYIKPTLDVEKFELTNSIAALSKNESNTLHETVDVHDWESFWN